MRKTRLASVLLLVCLLALLATAPSVVQGDAFDDLRAEAVTGLQVYPGEDVGSIAVEWDAHPHPVWRYHVSWRPSGESFRRLGDRNWNLESTDPSAVITGLTPANAYDIRVKAKFLQSTSAWSETETATAKSNGDEPVQATPQPGCPDAADAGSDLGVTDSSNYSTGKVNRQPLWRVDLQKDVEYLLVVKRVKLKRLRVVRICTPYFREMDTTGIRYDIPGGGAYFRFKPDLPGTYYIEVDGTPINSTFKIRVRELREDDCAADTDTSCTVDVGGSVTGVKTHYYDRDWYKVVLNQGSRYRIDMRGRSTDAGSMDAPRIHSLRDSDGERIGKYEDFGSGLVDDARLEYVAEYGGTHYIVAGQRGGWDKFAEVFTLEVTLRPDDALPYDDCSDDSTTACSLEVGSTIRGEINRHPAHVRPRLFGANGDVDWYSVELDTGVEYAINMKTVTGRTGVHDSYIEGVYGSSGSLYAGANDNVAEWDANAQVIFRPPLKLTYYVGVRAGPAWHPLTPGGLFTLQVTSTDDSGSAPAIRGSARVGETLTADTSAISDDEGMDNALFSYQWMAGETDIKSATESSYTLTENEQGKAVKVRASFTDDAGNPEARMSAATAEVEPRPDTQATGAPVIMGTARVGEALTADTSGISDEDGLNDATYSYQWLADDAAIADATGSTYTLVDADEGAIIKVRVSFTDDAGNEEELTSKPTDAVAAAEPAEPPAKPTGLSVVASHDRVVLSWDDPGDDAITGYVILRRDRAIHEIGTFVTVAEDTGSEDTGYTDGTVEPEKRYVYRIKAMNEHGLSEISHGVRANTPAPPLPAQPTGLTATASHEQVVLSWDDPQDDSITGYVILRRNRATTAPGEFTELVSDTGSTATAYTDDSVSADTSYTYRIKAINEHGGE